MGKKTDGQIKQEIIKELGRLKYDYVADRALTEHPDDWYLRVVHAKNSREHVVWIYNASLGSLQSGNYYDNEQSAVTGYVERK